MLTVALALFDSVSMNTVANANTVILTPLVKDELMMTPIFGSQVHSAADGDSAGDRGDHAGCGRLSLCGLQHRQHPLQPRGYAQCHR